jgi:hypothetical protein
MQLFAICLCVGWVLGIIYVLTQISDDNFLIKAIVVYVGMCVLTSVCYRYSAYYGYAPAAIWLVISSILVVTTLGKPGWFISLAGVMGGLWYLMFKAWLGWHPLVSGVMVLVAIVVVMIIIAFIIADDIPSKRSYSSSQPSTSNLTLAQLYGIDIPNDEFKYSGNKVYLPRTLRRVSGTRCDNPDEEQILHRLVHDLPKYQQIDDSYLELNGIRYPIARLDIDLLPKGTVIYGDESIVKYYTDTHVRGVKYRN